MKIVLQRVNFASVTVGGEVVGSIGKGYLILLGIGGEDTEEDCRRLADKIMKLRIFPDENDKTNLSINDVDGKLLIVSQFTLYADCRKNRPGFSHAAPPDMAKRLYEYFVDYCRSLGKEVQTGIFGEYMKVALENDGPFTLELE
ncbi:MAG: D-tyrosyl-tRNA(Tyr) deacylase [Ruminococcus sp.]|nr:D-tyrosyl-tRNA(Tyr) deacylase [Ruminococcus sp.]